MNESYVQGFTAKCAELGVASEALLKEAVRGDYIKEIIQAAKPGGVNVKHYADEIQGLIGWLPGRN